MTRVDLEQAIWERRGRRSGHEIVFACPVHAPDLHPSARWNPAKQTWYCDVCDAGGGYVDLARRLDAVVPSNGLVRVAPAMDEREPERRRHKIERLWAEGVPGDRALATYLRSRGLSGSVPSSLRLHRMLPYYTSRDSPPVGHFPAMLAKVETLDGRVMAVHKTYLASDGSGKAAVPKPKKLSPVVVDGGTIGCAIHLYPAQGARLALAEGIEKAIAIHEATGVPVWAARSAGALASVVVPEWVTEVELWGDHDTNETGQRAVAKRAAELRDGKRVRVVTIIPKGPGDWSDQFEAHGPDALREAQAEAYAVEHNGHAGISSFSSFSSRQEKADSRDGIGVPPYPVEALPPVARKLVEEGANAIGCPADMVASPLLTMAGAAIGRNQRIELKPGFEQYPMLWTAVVADPGTGKSPAEDLARHGLDELQATAHAEYVAAREHYETAEAAWQGKKSDDRGPAPHKPEQAQLFTTDITLETVAPYLERNAGIAIVREELVSWVRSFDAYRGGRGGDRQNWLSMWAGAPLKTDRRRVDSVYVPHPVVGVAGGIQPDMLGELADEAGRKDGFLERILWSFPNTVPIRWSDEIVDPQTKINVVSVFRTLRSTRSDAPVRLSAEAKKLFIRWHDENVDATARATGLVQGLYAKLPLQLARIALILHRLDFPGAASNRHVSAETMAGAIAIADYHAAHALRVLPRFGALVVAAPERSLGMRILAILRAKGPGFWVNRTELHDALGRNFPAEDIGRALEDLERDELAETRRVATGGRGRPSEECRFSWREENEQNEKISRETVCRSCGRAEQTHVAWPDVCRDWRPVEVPMRVRE